MRNIAPVSNRNPYGWCTVMAAVAHPSLGFENVLLLADCLGHLSYSQNLL